MTKFDRILQLIGLAATGVVITGASGGIAMPAWLMITASVLTFVTGASSAPVLRKPESGTKPPETK